MVKRALLIGCNYTAIPQVRLYGCINDIVNVRNVLIDAYGYAPSNIVMLRDDTANKLALPTRANILAQLTALFAASSSNDEVWVHYSGHGTQVRDTNGDEIDGSDEAIVPCDFNTAGMITDDTLFGIVKSAKCRALLFFDSCHSGTVCDLQYIRNYNNGVITVGMNNARVITNSNIIMMSGCRDMQTSADAYSTALALSVGAFTNALLESLRANDHSVDIMKLYSDTCAYLKAGGYVQIPALCSTVQTPAYTFARNNVGQTLKSVPATSSAPTIPMKFIIKKDVSSSSNVSTQKQLRSVMKQIIGA